ncbi:hypothetical protein ACFXTH_001471 [Malus domestica]
MMGDPLGSSCVSSQKQNHEGVVGAQSRQYRATVESSSGSALGSSCLSSQKQNREGVVGAQSRQYRATVESSSENGPT